MPEVQSSPELREAVIRVDVIDGTRLVHIDAGRFGLVLTAHEARAIATELQRTARRAASQTVRRQPLVRRRGGRRGDARR